MQTPSNTPASAAGSGKSSPETKVSRRRFNRRALGRLLAGFLVFLTFVMLFYVEEKVRGRWAWHRYQRAMERQGLSFDVKTVFPPPLPPEKNLACGPTLKPLYDYVLHQKALDTNALQRLWSVSYFPISSNYQYLAQPYSQWRDAVWPDPVKMLGEPSPLKRKGPPPPATPTALEAARLLTNLIEKASGPTLAGLKAESRTCPTGHFDFPTTEQCGLTTLMPHLSALMILARQYQMLAVAQLFLDQNDDAYENILIGFRLSNLIRDEPFSISQSARIHINEYLLGAIWFGMAKHQWTSAQLAEFQRQLEGVHVVDEIRHALNAERILSQHYIENFAQRFPDQIDFSTFSDRIYYAEAGARSRKQRERWFSQLYPKGWFYLEQINLQRFFVDYAISPIPTNQTRINLLAYEEDVKVVRQLSEQWPMRSARFREIISKKLWAHSLFQNLGIFVGLSRVMHCQIGHDLAATACALERYRLDNGVYPKQLSALVPKYLKEVPFDYLSGQALKYQLKEDGAFLLYSFGRNGVDDGGKVVVRKSGTVDQTEGDWVWQYPSSQTNSPGDVR